MVKEKFAQPSKSLKIFKHDSRSRHGHKYSQYKKCLSIIMMFICINQHLSNIWSSIYEKVKQYWGWGEKSVAYKKACFLQRVPMKKTALNVNLPWEFCALPWDWDLTL